MRASLVLLLVGLCRTQSAPFAPGGVSVTSREAGEVPASHLRMLSLGLAHLLQGVEENVARLEKQGDVVVAELEVSAKSVESIREHNTETGRAHKQARKDVQILSARGDGLWRAVTDLQRVLEDLGTEQRTTKQRLNLVLQRGEGLGEPRSGGPTQADMSSVKILIEKQAVQIANLASEVLAQERTINRRLQHIKRLEKQLSSGV